MLTWSADAPECLNSANGVGVLRIVCSRVACG